MYRLPGNPISTVQSPSTEDLFTLSGVLRSVRKRCRSRYSSSTRFRILFGRSTGLTVSRVHHSPVTGVGTLTSPTDPNRDLFFLVGRFLPQFVTFFRLSCVTVSVPHSRKVLPTRGPLHSHRDKRPSGCPCTPTVCRSSGSTEEPVPHRTGWSKGSDWDDLLLPPLLPPYSAPCEM